MIPIELPQCVVRDWRCDDRSALVRHANNHKVWRNLTHAFPHPYTEADADAWFAFVASCSPRSHFAIEVDGQAIGGVGVSRLEGIFAGTGEFGYWLAEPYWGRGIASAVARATPPVLMPMLQLHRLEAAVFEWNPASMRVLEKAGFEREGVLRKSVLKDGRLIDRTMYALTARA